VLTDRTVVSRVFCLLSLATLASCFGKPINIKAGDAAVAGQQSDGRGAGGEVGPGDGPSPVADSKIATDGPTSNGGSGVDSGSGGSSGTVDSSVAGSGGSSTGGSSVADSGVGGGGGGAGGVTASDASANGGSNAGGSSGAGRTSDASASGGSSAGGSSGAGSGGNIGGGVAGSGGTGPDAAPDVPPDVPAVDAPGACSADKDCTSPAPLCLGNRCTKCAGDSDCAGRAGPACAASGLCVACTSNKHCTGTAGTCNPATNQCVGCVSRSDCTSACQTCTSGVCVAVKGKDDPGFCDGTCDPAGTCKRKQGQTCQKTTDCAGGLPCADGYCCDRACTGSCEACDIAAPSPGTCTSLPAGASPYASHPACSTYAACAGKSGDCVCSKTTCGGACVDTESDPKNCGSCPHDCLGGACITGHCQPAVVVGSTAVLSVIGVDSTSLYYEAYDGLTKLAYRISKTGQGATGSPLHSGDFDSSYLGVIGTKLFFSPVPEEFRYCDINSTDSTHCAATTATMPGPGKLASFKSQIPPAQYFALVDDTPPTGATISWYSTSGTLVKTITDSPSVTGDPYLGVFAYGDAVYWIRSYFKPDLTRSDDILYTASIANPALTYLTNYLPPFTYYLIEANAKSVLLRGPSNGLYRVVRNGNPNSDPSLLYSTGSSATISGATEDANAVYWQQSDGTLNSCLATFCQRQILVFGQDFSGGWQQDDSALYWGNATGSGGQVMRLAK